MFSKRFAMSGSVAVALLELAQFAGPRPVNPPMKPWDYDRSSRPIVCVNADGLSVHTYFTPTDNPVEHPEHGIIERLKQAKETVRMQAYGFTSQKIAEELIDARRRGVDVQILLDRSEETDRHTRAWDCQKAGINIRFDEAHAIAHNKILIVDGRMVFTGSYNFTEAAAKHNAENMVLIVGDKIAEQFTANWTDHAKHSKEWMPTPP